MLWNGGCKLYLNQTVLIKFGVRSSMNECRKFCGETDKCAMFFVSDDDGSDVCDLYTDEAITTCEIDDPPLQVGFTAYSVHKCGIGMEI